MLKSHPEPHRNSPPPPPLPPAHHHQQQEQNQSSGSSYHHQLVQHQHHHHRGVPVPPPMLCTGCGGLISDRFLLQVNGLGWHSKCLVCVSCAVPLDGEALCYVRNSNVYCRTDYYRLFGTKCSKCSRQISPTDWVRRARDQVYHLACFACDACKRQLSTGEEFALADEKVLCKTHFQELFDCPTPADRDARSSNEDSGDDPESSSDHRSSSSSKSKTKRVRTTFTDEQLQVLQANFQIDSNPDGQDLERIAQITGLSKRVTQVWFQNSRARQKKHLQKQKRKQWPSSQHQQQQQPQSTQSQQQQQQTASSTQGTVPTPSEHHHHHQHHHQQTHHQHHRSFEKTSAASQLSEDEPAASPLTMLYSF